MERRNLLHAARRVRTDPIGSADNSLAFDSIPTPDAHLRPNSYLDTICPIYRHDYLGEEQNHGSLAFLSGVTTYHLHPSVSQYSVGQLTDRHPSLGRLAFPPLTGVIGSHNSPLSRSALLLSPEYRLPLYTDFATTHTRSVYQGALQACDHATSNHHEAVGQALLTCTTKMEDCYRYRVSMNSECVHCHAPFRRHEPQGNV